MAVRPEPMPHLRATLVLAVTVLCVFLMSGCVVQGRTGSGPLVAGPSAPWSSATAPRLTSSATTGSAQSTTGPSTRRSARSATRSPTPSPHVLASDGKPRDSSLTIPALGIEDLPVKLYRGSPDDARGTRIQNRGIAASPYGPDGGVGPGGIGNQIITAHRLSSTRAFLKLPKLRVGAKVQLVASGQRYTYRIVGTRTVSFRSTKSLAAQAAAVPGRPGVRATQAMITLSTCRTPEDHAEGNYWSDEFGNPEHRIDKIGKLVAVAPA
jgi:sortase A